MWSMMSSAIHSVLPGDSGRPTQYFFSTVKGMIECTKRYISPPQCLEEQIQGKEGIQQWLMALTDASRET